MPSVTSQVRKSHDCISAAIIGKKQKVNHAFIFIDTVNRQGVGFTVRAIGLVV